MICCVKTERLNKIHDDTLDFFLNKDTIKKGALNSLTKIIIF